jgi:isocitrate lyase
MGKGSTQVQHLKATELPKKVLEDWLATWAEAHGIDDQLRVRLQPSREGTEVIELSILGTDGEKLADVVFAPIHDRKGRTILSVRDQNTFDESLRRKRLQALIHLYLFSRYQVDSVHYVAPTDDNAAQCERMKAWGIYTTVSN